MWSSKLLYFRVDVDYILSLILCTSLNWENAVIRGGGNWTLGMNNMNVYYKYSIVCFHKCINAHVELQTTVE